MTRLTLCLSIVVAGVSLIAATAQTTTQTGPSQNAKAVLDTLMKEQPPVTAPKWTPKPATPIAQPVKQAKAYQIPLTSAKDGKGTGQKLLPEGAYIVDRRGRLAAVGDAWQFVFESDGKTMGDPPIILLPNRWLEKMQADVTAGSSTIVFRISGEVTCYHNRNYLLLRKVIIDPDSLPRYSK